MNITEIIARNLGGKDFQHPLTKINLIVGPNASGKTAVSNGLKTGLFGYLPRLGKQPGATWKLAGENRSEMNIALRFEPSSMTAHTWKRDPKGSISYSVDNPLTIPIVLLDTKDYFQRTTADRIKFIFDKIDPVTYGWQDDQLIGKLEKIEVIPASVGNKAVTELIALVKETIVYRDNVKQSHQVWLDTLAEKLKDKKKEYDVEAKRLGSGGIRKSIPAFKPVNNSARISELEKLIAAAQAEISKDEAEKAAWERNNIRREQLQFKIKLENWSDNRESLKKQIAAAEKAVAGYVSDTPKLGKAFAEARGTYKQVKQQIADVSAEIKDREQKLVEILKSPCCPFCKSDKPDWQGVIQAEYEGVLTKLHDTKADLQKRQKELETSGVKLKADLAVAEAKDIEEGKHVNTLETVRKAIQESEKIASDMKSHQSELDGLNNAGTPPNETRIEVNKASKANFETELVGARKIKQDFDYHKSVTERADDAEKQYTEKFTFAEVYKLAIKETLAVQARMVSLAFCKILEKATSLTEGLLRAPLDYRDDELGMMLPDGWVSHETFSGFEEMLAYSGLSVALAQESPIKIVIMDELGRLDADNKIKLIGRMIELTNAGVLDQFVGIDVSAKDYAGLDGINFIIV